MKLLIIGSFNKPKNGSYGGIFYACSTLANELVRNGFDVLQSDTTLNDINNIGVLRRIPTLLIRNLKINYKILKNRDIKYVMIFVSAGNSYLDKLPFVVVSRLLGKKVIIFPRSGFLLRDYKKSIYKRVINFVLKRSHCVICQSSFWQSFFKRVIPVSKTVVIENWVSKETFKRSALLKYNTYNKNQVAKLVYIGRIEEAKGINDILNGAVLLKDRGFRFIINIFGDGSYKEQLLTDIKTYSLEKHVFYNGWLQKEEILQEINGHHLALFTSRFEGYPNSLLDIIFAKIPVLITNVDSIKAVSEQLLCYNPGNSEELAGLIINTFDNFTDYIAVSAKIYEKKLEKNNIENSINILSQKAFV